MGVAPLTICHSPPSRFTGTSSEDGATFAKMAKRREKCPKNTKVAKRKIAIFSAIFGWPGVGGVRSRGRRRRRGAELDRDIYNWAHGRRRFGRRKSLPFGIYSRTLRTLRPMCEPVGRAPTIGRLWLWRLRNSHEDIR